jgi:DNA-directed RNA polymerase subunit RPC12/RpoP
MELPMRKDAQKKTETEKTKKTAKDTSEKPRLKSTREISIGDQEMEDEDQLERKEAYIEVETQRLLRDLLHNSEHQEVLPSYDPAKGFVYKSVEPVFEPEIADSKKVSDLLERLASLDILKRSFYDSVSTCPNCESTKLTLHTSCPKCKSHYIIKTSLTEHIPCGYIGEREKYIDGKCPNCKQSLENTPYADMGRWYKCKACGERFEHPQFNVVCRECSHSFMIEEAKVREIPKYTLNPSKTKEIRQNVASLENISNLLTELGFTIEMPGSATGSKSGMEYHFSLLAKKQTGNGEIVIAVDQQATEEEVQASPLILFIYKISEIKVDLPIFIALPRLSESARKIAKGHDISIIEGSPEGTDSLTNVKEEIQRRINQKLLPQMQDEAAAKAEAEMEQKPQTISSQSAGSNEKSKGPPLRNWLGKLKRTSNTVQQIPTPEPPAEETTQQSNIVFLLDGSSSMKEGKTSQSKFDLALKAIESVITNPDPKTKDDMLSVIIFWDEIIKGFQKEVLYENMSMGEYMDPQRLYQFGKPKNNVGTPLWDAVEYTVEFLMNKKGKKMVKIITDAYQIPRLKKAETVSKLEESQVQLDCIIVGSEEKLRDFSDIFGDKVRNAKMCRFFESPDLESLALALKA